MGLRFLSGKEKMVDVRRVWLILILHLEVVVLVHEWLLFDEVRRVGGRIWMWPPRCLLQSRAMRNAFSLVCG